MEVFFNVPKSLKIRAFHLRNFSLNRELSLKVDVFQGNLHQRSSYSTLETFSGI